MMGFFLIVCGSTINIKQVGMPLYKGVVLTGIKFVLGVLLGLAVGKICGPTGFLGITPFVMIALCALLCLFAEFTVKKTAKKDFAPASTETSATSEKIDGDNAEN